MDDEEHDDFQTYFTERLPGLLRLAYLLTADAAAAEDLAQTALARTFVAWRRVRASDSPDAYVCRILINAHRRQFRTRRIAETLVPVVPDRAPSAGGELAAVDDRAGLAAALAVLPRRQRAVVVLRYCEDLPEARVAEILGCSVGTVKTHASRGLARLRANPSLRLETGIQPAGAKQRIGGRAGRPVPRQPRPVEEHDEIWGGLA